MKRGNRHPERAPDQLALLLDFAMVQVVVMDSRRLNAQPENLLAAAARYGVQIRIGPNRYPQEPRQQDQHSGADRLHARWNLPGTGDWQFRRHPKVRNGQKRQGWSWLPVLFAHPASGSYGLNLQDGGNIRVYFGHRWNLEGRMQILERIGPTRQKQAGHDRPVFALDLFTRYAIDKEIIERAATMREVQDISMDAMKQRFKS